jgi:antirestriction protein ArdC
LKNRFGSREYAAEELVAELGAAFLSAEFGFDGDVRNAGYVPAQALAYGLKSVTSIPLACNIAIASARALAITSAARSSAA